VFPKPGDRKDGGPLAMISGLGAFAFTTPPEIGKLGEIMFLLGFSNKSLVANGSGTKFPPIIFPATNRPGLALDVVNIGGPNELGAGGTIGFPELTKIAGSNA
jgi:hypothetical protein